ncbi:MAG: ASPIC/UnbV domain-containing protein [Terriglobia bacterium]
MGARVLARYSGRIQAQEVLSQSSFYPCNDSRLHFGLGQAITADLVIRWPSGITEKYPSVKCNQLVTIRESRGIIPNRGWAR